MCTCTNLSPRFSGPERIKACWESLRANIFIESTFTSFDTVTEDDTFLQFIFSRYNSRYTGPAMCKFKVTFQNVA